MFARAEAPYVDLSVLDESTDTELIQLLKLGNEDALGVLLRRHRDALYRFCVHLMADRDDAEDICQESMTRAILRVDSLQSGAAFRSWLFSIARNLSVDSHRSRKRICQLPDEELVPLPLPLRQDSPYEQVEIAEEHQTVAEALQRLKKNHQTVLMMREVEGLSYAEIADRLDVSQSAVETLLFRARRRLREEYGKSSAPMPAFALIPFLRGLLGRLASPISGVPIVAKVAISAAIIGGAAITTSHVVPQLIRGEQAQARTSILVGQTIPVGHGGPVAVPVKNPGPVAGTSAGRSSGRGLAGNSGVARSKKLHGARASSGRVPSAGKAFVPSPGHTSWSRRSVPGGRRRRAGPNGAVVPVKTPGSGRPAPAAASTPPGSGPPPGTIHAGSGRNRSPSHVATVVTPPSGTNPRHATTSSATAVPSATGSKAASTALPQPVPSVIPGSTQVAIPVNQVPTAVGSTVKGAATQVGGQVQQQATQVTGQVNQVATQVSGQVKQVVTQVPVPTVPPATQVAAQVKQQATRVSGVTPKVPIPTATIPVHLPH